MVTLQLSPADDGVVIRGCWNTAPEAHKTACSADNENCDKCNGEGCNRKDHSGSAALVVALPLVVLAALVSVAVQ